MSWVPTTARGAGGGGQHGKLLSAQSDLIALELGGGGKVLPDLRKLTSQKRNPGEVAVPQPPPTAVPTQPCSQQLIRDTPEVLGGAGAAAWGRLRVHKPGTHSTPRGLNWPG